ncbi:MAG: TlpA family protein disulfide reductase [Nitrospirae bacterium]|nr:TlpA family protein disulfide reductase [Nitrospirota bacterium]
MVRNVIGSIIFACLFLVTQLSWGAWLNDRAPDFSLQDRYGKTISLGDMKGRVVFVNFWANWCPPCKKEFPELNKLSKKYKEADFVILAINLDKQRANVDDFLGKLPEPLSDRMIILLDPRSRVVSSYGARAMPTSFIIDKQETIRYVHLGFNESDPGKWITEIDSLIK